MGTVATRRIEPSRQLQRQELDQRMARLQARIAEHRARMDRALSEFEAAHAAFAGEWQANKEEATAIDAAMAAIRAEAALLTD